MDTASWPPFLAACVCPEQEALRHVVRSGTTVASGFATSEPSPFYHALWDFIRQQDITDLVIRQALFMGAYPICVGDRLAAMAGRPREPGRFDKLPGVAGSVARSATGTARKLSALKSLIEHYRELRERRVTFDSAFMGPASNIVVPDNAVTRALYPEYAGRNASRMGVVNMQSLHFPDGLEGLAYNVDGSPKFATFAAPMTPPDDGGEMSHGAASGANAEIIEKIARQCDVDLLLYVNSQHPFTRGYRDARNTLHVSELEALAKKGRLRIVLDDSPVPALPAGSFDSPSEAEDAIAKSVVNHIELNLASMTGRALQVGIGTTGVLAIKALRESKWKGRCYTEMLEPFTMSLFESGRIEGSHFVEKNGTRTMLDGKLVCTFTFAEKGSDFYRKLDRNDSIVVAPAARVVVSEGFYDGLGINNILAVDFHGNVNCAARDRNHLSGIGGAAMIHRGLTRGGVAYLCLKSTHRTAEGERRSSIFPYLPRGTPVGQIGPDLMGGREGARVMLVTEHGIVQVSGLTQWDFIKAVISVADPAFRPWLRREAWKEFRVSA